MISDKAKSCPNCGYPNPYIAKEENPSRVGSDFNLTDRGQSGKTRIAFGWFCIFLGCIVDPSILQRQNQGMNSKYRIEFSWMYSNISTSNNSYIGISSRNSSPNNDSRGI